MDDTRAAEGVQVVPSPATATSTLHAESPATAAPVAVWTLPKMTAAILRNEGGYVDDPVDAGGATNQGISLRFARTHPAFFDLNGDGVVDGEDIRALTPEKAAEAYVAFFYEPARFYELPNVSNIVVQLFDLAVTAGVRYSDGESEAVKVLQHAIGISADGELGPATLKSLLWEISYRGAEAVNNGIAKARINFYNQVVHQHPGDLKFLDGWIKRANSFRV